MRTKTLDKAINAANNIVNNLADSGDFASDCGNLAVQQLRETYLEDIAISIFTTFKGDINYEEETYIRENSY
jgi:hypothetical protein